uniref:Uncharacterized protein n=1 Tax=Candidatus Kentrum sp. UNK TaxID=2126344 RepID=A0A451B3Z3_9GAMM|nr:MAG: hypothetical protein BECKUNK1418G_GA0071005_12114 [Candidatus Kentron sp. UNK]VFK73002.1 MAG: hypothetical protein BECKUNK1418H_GA0071006_11568 [Candidatus Kentron sp. UNK]
MRSYKVQFKQRLAPQKESQRTQLLKHRLVAMQLRKKFTILKISADYGGYLHLKIEINLKRLLIVLNNSKNM